MKKLLKGSSKNATINSYCNCESVPCKSTSYCRGWCDDNFTEYTTTSRETANTYYDQWSAKSFNSFK